MDWTEARKIELRSLLAQGKKRRDIALHFEITKNALISAIHRYTDVKSPSPIRPIPSETKAAIREALTAGRKIPEIAQEFQVSESGVDAIRRTIGAPRETLPPLASVAAPVDRSPQPAARTKPAAVVQPAPKVATVVRGAFGSRECLWTEGNHGNYRFCTEPRAKGPFCAEHALRGFTKRRVEDVA